MGGGRGGGGSDLRPLIVELTREKERGQGAYKYPITRLGGRRGLCCCKKEEKIRKKKKKQAKEKREKKGRSPLTGEDAQAYW